MPPRSSTGLIAAALTVVLLGDGVPGVAQQGKSIAVAPARSVAWTLDGSLAEWDDSDAIVLDATSYLLTDSADYSGNPDLSGSIHFAWDSVYLYFAGRFADDIISEGAAWTSDRVNLVFDFRNDNHPLSYGGRAPDASHWQSDDHWVYSHIFGDGQPPYPVMRLARDYHGPIAGAQLVSRLADDGWSFEARIPWSELAEARPFVGAVMGLQLFVSDGDGSGRLTEIMWSAPWGYSKDSGLVWELWLLGKLVLTDGPLAASQPAGGS